MSPLLDRHFVTATPLLLSQTSSSGGGGGSKSRTAASVASFGTSTEETCWTRKRRLRRQGSRQLRSTSRSRSPTSSTTSTSQLQQQQQHQLHDADVAASLYAIDEEELDEDDQSDSDGHENIDGDDDDGAMEDLETAAFMVDLVEDFFENDTVANKSAAGGEFHDTKLERNLDVLESFVSGEKFLAKQQKPPLSKKATVPKEVPSTQAAADVRHEDAAMTVESEFCKNFSCCGLVLTDLHDLLQHYEECHVHVEGEMQFAEAHVAERSLSASGGGSGDLSLLDERNDADYHRAVDDAFDSREPVIAAFDDSFITKRVDIDPFSASGANSPTENDYDYAQSPLAVRRIGDVEDDLGVRLLEMMKDEMERDGKRLKLMSDVVTDPALSSANSRQRTKRPSRRRQAAATAKPGANGDEEEVVDILTVADNTSSSADQHQLMGDTQADSDGAHGSAKNDVNDGNEEPLPDEDDIDADDDQDDILFAVDGIFDPQRYQQRQSLDDNTNYPQNVSAAISGMYEQPLRIANDRRKRLPVFFDEFGDKIEKPYRCTHFGCDKAYKNPNGLKYHTQHGHLEIGDDQVDIALRFMKPYVCNYAVCYKRYKNLNGLKYHIEKAHGLNKTESNKLATNIVKKTNANFGIHSRSVPNSVLFAAMKEREDLTHHKRGDVNSLSKSDMAPLLQLDHLSTERHVNVAPQPISVPTTGGVKMPVPLAPRISNTSGGGSGANGSRLQLQQNMLQRNNHHHQHLRQQQQQQLKQSAMALSYNNAMQQWASLKPHGNGAPMPLKMSSQHHQINKATPQFLFNAGGAPMRSGPQLAMNGGTGATATMPTAAQLTAMGQPLTFSLSNPPAYLQALAASGMLDLEKLTQLTRQQQQQQQRTGNTKQ